MNCYERLLLSLLALALVTHVVGSVESRHEEDAIKYFAEGEILFLEEDFATAAAFYRAAVRLNPGSAPFLYKLGITEFSLGLKKKAYRRVNLAIKLNKTLMEDNEYREDILNILATGADAQNSNKDNEIERVVHTKPLYELDFKRLMDSSSCTSHIEVTGGNFRRCNAQDTTIVTPLFQEPFVVRSGSAASAEWTTANVNVSSLNDKFGNSVLVDFYPQNMLRSPPEKSYKRSLSEALDYLDYPEGAYLSVDTSEMGTYIQMNVNYSTFTSILALANISLERGVLSLFDTAITTGFDATSSEGFFKDNTGLRDSFLAKAHWFMLLIGEKDAGMFGHEDVLPVGSWQVQIQGRKRWRICPSGLVWEERANSRHEDPYENDQTKASKEECWETILSAGDTLYYPPHFWHETSCLESPTISISSSVDLGHGVLQNFLRRECDHFMRGNVAAPSTETQTNISCDGESCGGVGTMVRSGKFNLGPELCLYFLQEESQYTDAYVQL